MPPPKEKEGMLEKVEDEKGLQLFEATEKGSLEDLITICKVIGNDSDSVNYQNPEMWLATPLYCASMNGETQKVKHLLEFFSEKIDVNLNTEHGWTPLATAAYNNHAECLALLCAHSKIEINKSTKNGVTPISWSAASDNIECLKFLIAHPDADINKADDDGATPLLRAVQKGHVAAVRVCLQHPGIDINRANKEGYQPIHVAKKAEIKSLLRARGSGVPHQTGGCCSLM